MEAYCSKVKVRVEVEIWDQARNQPQEKRCFEYEVNATDVKYLDEVQIQTEVQNGATSCLQDIGRIIKGCSSSRLGGRRDNGGAGREMGS